jgi:hypothetical protein
VRWLRFLVVLAIVGVTDPLRATEWWQPTAPLCPIDDCDDSEYDKDAGVSRVFRGIYSHGGKHSVFVATGAKCGWWMSGNLGQLRKDLDATWPHLLATATVEVEGTLTPPGCYGHIGGARRELKVTKVISFKITEVVPLSTLLPGR